MKTTTATSPSTKMSESSNRRVTILEPNRIEKQYWRDLWDYRELFIILSWRDIAVRYKQTFVGVAWAILRPLLTMIVFTFIFGRIAKLPSIADVPYPILVFSGLLPWQFFSSALASCSDSLITNRNMLSKVYFPRLIIPASAVITNLIDFFLSFLVLIVLMFYYRWTPSLNIVTLPIWILIAFFATAGPGLLFASLNVRYRDFQYVVPFVIQLGLYISPVAFSASIIPKSLLPLYSLNPMVSVIEGFRWAIIGHGLEIPAWSMALSLSVLVVTFVYAINQFRTIEKNISDLI
jgi:lipopolysaccharide transport system permease protein